MSFQERIVFFVETVTKGGTKVDEIRKSIEKLGVQSKKATKFFEKETGQFISKATALDNIRHKTNMYSSSLAKLDTTSKKFRLALSQAGVGFEDYNKIVEAGTNKAISHAKVQERALKAYNSWKGVFNMTNKEFSNVDRIIGGLTKRQAKLAIKFRKAGINNIDSANKIKKSFTDFGNVFDLTNKEFAKGLPLINQYGNSTTKLAIRFREAGINNIDSANKIKKSLTNFSTVLNLTNEDFAQGLPLINQYGNRASKLSARFREMTVGIKGFRTEILTLLFFGMALKNWMNNLLNPAAELFGIFELIDISKMLLFEPVMEKILPLFIKLLEFVEAIPRPIKEVIGWFVILVGIAGTVAMGFALVTFGISATLQNLNLLSGALKIFSWKGFLIPVLKILAIAGAIYVVKKALSEFSNSSDYARTQTTKLKNAWADYFDFSEGIFSKFKTTLKENEKGITSWGKMWVYLGAVFTNISAGIGVAFNAASSVVALGIEAMVLTFTPLILGLRLLAEAYYAVAIAMARKDGNDWKVSQLREERDGVRSLGKELTSLSGKWNRVKNIIDDGAKKQDNFIKSMVSPSKIVDEYVAEMERKFNSDKVKEQLLTPTGSGLMTPLPSNNQLISQIPISAFAQKTPDIYIDINNDNDFSGAIDSSGVQRAMDKAYKDNIAIIEKNIGKNIMNDIMKTVGKN